LSNCPEVKRPSGIMCRKCVCVQHVTDQLALHASAGLSSLCSLLALVGQSQSDLLAVVPAKLVVCFYYILPLVTAVIFVYKLNEYNLFYSLLNSER